MRDVVEEAIRQETSTATTVAPKQCLLCGAADGIGPAGFTQQFAQYQSAPRRLTWWRCSRCGGWFAHPVPTIEEIRRNWATESTDPAVLKSIEDGKHVIAGRVLTGLAKRKKGGSLLDVGCHTGVLMELAREAGWQVAGIEPNDEAADVARRCGLEVRSAWKVADARYAPGTFDVVTATDVFGWSWSLFDDLTACYKALKRGGVLAMRVSNKRFIVGWQRRLTSAGACRDAIVSRTLQQQFHSISLRSLAGVLRKVGFATVQCEPRATKWRRIPWKTWLAYSVADMLRWTTLGRVDLSPGVLVYATKPQ